MRAFDRIRMLRKAYGDELIRQFHYRDLLRQASGCNKEYYLDRISKSTKVTQTIDRLITNLINRNHETTDDYIATSLSDYEALRKTL